MDTELASTPFVASWMGSARSGDLFDPDQERRAAAWAHWALARLEAYTGVSKRPYHAITLPGVFYDPKGTGTGIRPHLEIPTGLLAVPDPLFPERLAQMGNGLLFEWWLFPEVKAVRKALNGAPKGDISPLVEVLSQHRNGLVEAYGELSEIVAKIWPQVQADLIADPALLTDLMNDGFDEMDTQALMPGAGPLGLVVAPEAGFSETADKWLARRVGVWRLTGKSSAGEFGLGVITPRLTKSSLFQDALFAPGGESAAALFVRSLLLKQIAAQYGQRLFVTAEADTAPEARPYLRSVPARVGEKLPEASLSAAILLVQTHPDADGAWGFIEKWANARGEDGNQRAALTVTKEGFKSAHDAISRAIRRGEDPERDDVNVVLPLAWDAGAKVVRLTLTRAGKHAQ